MDLRHWVGLLLLAALTAPFAYLAAAGVLDYLRGTRDQRAFQRESAARMRAAQTATDETAQLNALWNAPAYEKEADR